MSPEPGSAGYPANYRVAWHRAECWNYSADLPLWRQLAQGASKRILDLGCGAGRVALDLAHRGHEVTGLDSDPVLLAALRDSEPTIDTVNADIRSFELGRSFDLILAPMQTLQLLTDAADRRSCLDRVHRHLDPDGLFAAAFVEIDPGLARGAGNLLAGLPTATDFDQLRPGLWASSASTGLFVTGDRLRIERRRAIHTDGEAMARASHQPSFELALLGPRQIETEYRDAGLDVKAWRTVGPTESHMGATVAIATRSCKSA